MKIKDLKKDDLDVITYDDLAYLILLESKKKMKINELFEKVCDIKGLGKDVYEAKIVDFFELLSTDKKFIMIEKGLWDLRERHSDKIKIETDNEEDDIISDVIEKADDEETEEPSVQEDIFYEPNANDDEIENDLSDLVVISGDDEETDGL